MKDNFLCKNDDEVDLHWSDEMKDAQSLHSNKRHECPVEIDKCTFLVPGTKRGLSKNCSQRPL